MTYNIDRIPLYQAQIDWLNIHQDVDKEFSRFIMEYMYGRCNPDIDTIYSIQQAWLAEWLEIC